MDIIVDNEINTIMNMNNKSCGICGEKHFYKDCKYVTIFKCIPDKQIATRARLSLPDMLDIITLADGTFTVITKLSLPVGVEFGPFVAKKDMTLNPFIKFPLKLFNTEDPVSNEFYLDTTDENECCWMMFVSPASETTDQNMVCYQEGNDVFFATTKTLNKGEALKVWYSPYYATKMQKHILPNDSAVQPLLLDTPKNDADLNTLIKEQQKIIPREFWNCKFCYKLEKGVIEFAKHLYGHYSLQKRKTCLYCKQTFLHTKDYKNHLNLFHDANMAEMGKSIQSLQTTIKNHENVAPKRGTIELKDNCVGGPLLVHNMLTDCFDNSNLLVQQQEFNSLDIEVHGLLEGENLNLGVDPILNHTLKDFDYLNTENSKKDDEKEEYLCDICLKTFSNLKSITMHLKLHMGKYFCSTCKKVFGRLENLKQHKCNQLFSLKCPKCDKLFYQKKYLARHVSVVHEKKFSCKACRKHFHSPSELNRHVCRKVPVEKRTTYKCNECSKTFFKESYLLKHLKLHVARREKVDKETHAYICSQCSTTFSSKSVYERHLLTIHDRQRLHECRICDKTFNRADILKNHILNIHMMDSNEVTTCGECGKEFKSKKHLNSHMSSHEKIGFKCHCGALFKHKYNLKRHCKQFHESTVEKTSDESEALYHECPICNNKVKLKRSLQRHIRRKHAQEYKNLCLELSSKKIKMNREKKINRLNDMDFDNIDTDQKCRDLQKTIENMDFNLDACTDNLYSGTETIDKFLKESSEQIAALFADSPKAIDISSDISCITNTNKVNNREVCLSMPDLSEMDQEIKLGKNAYILENGNIVEPQGSSSNIVVYVLNDKTD